MSTPHCHSEQNYSIANHASISASHSSTSNTMSTPRPLEIPELRHHVAQFLERRELTACALVSRDWHRSFVPYVWQSLDIVSQFNDYEISAAVFQKHSSYIETLNCTNRTYPRYPSQGSKVSSSFMGGKTTNFSLFIGVEVRSIACRLTSSRIICQNSTGPHPWMQPLPVRC